MSPRTKRDVGRALVAVGILVLVIAVALGAQQISSPVVPLTIAIGVGLLLGGALVWTDRA